MDNNFENQLLEDAKRLTEYKQILERKVRLLEIKTEEIEKLNQRIQELETEKESFRNMMNACRIKKDELQAEIREKDELIEDLRHDLELARENGKTLYEMQCRDSNNLTDKIDKLERENREMLQKLKNVEAERNDLEDDNRRWEQVCCDQTDQIEELQAKLQQVEAVNDRMNRLEKEDYLDEIKQEVLEHAKLVEKYPFLFQNYSQADIIEECFDAIGRPLRVARYNDDRPCCGRKYRLCCDRYCKPAKRKKRPPENRE